MPIDPKTVDTFDPHTVPTLVTLFNELDSFKPSGAGDGDGSAHKRQRISDLDKTSLRGFMEYFEDHFLGPLYADAKAGWKQSRDRLAAATNSW